jgi:hypothetical protein
MLLFHPSSRPCPVSRKSHPVFDQFRPGNSQVSIAFKSPGSTGEPERGLNLKYIAKNTNDTLTTVTISITPSTLCQHYFMAALKHRRSIYDLLDFTGSHPGMRARRRARVWTGLTALIGIT